VRLQHHELREERRISAELRAEMHDTKVELDDERGLSALCPQRLRCQLRRPRCVGCG
jgi:hypothetical protein